MTVAQLITALQKCRPSTYVHVENGPLLESVTETAKRTVNYAGDVTVVYHVRLSVQK